MTDEEINQVIAESMSRVRGIAALELRPGADWDDLHQAALIRLWEVLKRGRWHAESGVYATEFARRSLRHAARRESRRHLLWPKARGGRSRIAQQLDEDFDRPADADPHDAVDVRDAVLWALEKLSERQRSVLRLRYGIGGPAQTELEIGAGLGLNRFDVYAAARDGKAAMQALLSPVLGELDSRTTSKNPAFPTVAQRATVGSPPPRRTRA